MQAAFQLHQAHVVPALGERRDQRLIARAALDLRRPVAAAEIRQVDRLLDVELPSVAAIDIDVSGDPEDSVDAIVAVIGRK